MTATATRERPILFSGPMVLAIMSGRKTQTRRIVKGADRLQANYSRSKVKKDKDGRWVFIGFLDEWNFGNGPCPRHFYEDFYLDRTTKKRSPPYGVPGDRLWVREAWREVEDSMGIPCIQYKADGALQVIGRREDGTYHLCGSHEAEIDSGAPWRPSIHMCLWMSRINLEITEVRVQRLQEIGEGDAYAEAWRGSNSLPVRCSGTLAASRLWGIRRPAPMSTPSASCGTRSTARARGLLIRGSGAFRSREWADRLSRYSNENAGFLRRSQP